MEQDRNPQHAQMADESMVRCLRAQADAIWPGEEELIRRYGLDPASDVLDVGCGTGEFVLRLGRMLPAATFVAIDVIESHLKLARGICAELGSRARFETGDAFELQYESDRFDLTVNRHMLQSIPTPEKVVGELIRVTRPGGRLHLLVEDYAMIHLHPVDGDTDRFWHQGAIAFGKSVGTDLRIGRRMFSILDALGMKEIDVRYVVVDTLRVPRETFAAVWEAWRDGFAEPIAANTGLSREEVDAYWQGMLDCLRDPSGYAVWHVPVITAVKPGRA